MAEEQSLAAKWGTFGAVATIIGWFIFIFIAFAVNSYFIAGIGLLISTIGEGALFFAFLFYLIGK